MKHFLFSLSRFVVIFLISSLVFFSLIVIAGRILTPFLNHQTQTVERFTGELLHKPVQIKQFSVNWQGLRPILKGKNVSIWNDSRTQCLFQIKQLDVGINLFKTLLTGSIQLGAVKGLGTQLVIHESKDKQFTLNGFNISLGQSEKDQLNGINAILGWLLASQVSLQDIGLSYYPASGAKWPDMKLNGTISNEYDRHYLSAQLQFLEKKTTKLNANC